jgi:hypothetical protein
MHNHNTLFLLKLLVAYEMSHTEIGGNTLFSPESSRCIYGLLQSSSEPGPLLCATVEKMHGKPTQLSFRTSEHGKRVLNLTFRPEERKTDILEYRSLKPIVAEVFGTVVFSQQEDRVPQLRTILLHLGLI